MRVWIGLALACCLASTAHAEMTQAQQAAYDVVLPEVTAALTEQGGEAAAAFAPALSECAVTQAKRKERRILADEDTTAEDRTALLNDLLTRPRVQGCLTKALQ